MGQIRFYFSSSGERRRVSKHSVTKELNEHSQTVCVLLRKYNMPRLAKTSNNIIAGHASLAYSSVRQASCISNLVSFSITLNSSYPHVSELGGACANVVLVQLYIGVYV
jgi:hypothetical protein